jgi:Bacterial Ig domain
MALLREVARGLGLTGVALLPLASALAAPAPESLESEQRDVGAVRITAPVDGATLSTPLAIGVQASDTSGVKTISLYADGIRLNTFACSTPVCSGSFVWVTDRYLPSGNYTLFAVSTNGDGVQTRSAAVTVTK